MIYGGKFERQYIAALLVGCVVLLATTAGAVGDTIHNQDPDFTLVVPSGYEQLQVIQPGTLYTFIQGRRQGSLPDAVVSVQVLGGTIGQEHLKLPPNTPASTHLTTVKWHGYDVDMVISNVSLSGLTMACRTVQIPLQHQAIQIVVGVPPERVGTADAILMQFLSGLDGPSNWPPPVRAADQRVFATRRIATAFIAPAIVGVLLALLIVRRVRAARLRESRPAVYGPPEVRRSGAIKVGVITTGITFSLLGIGSFLMFYLGYAAPIRAGDAERRGYQLMMGMSKLSFWCGLIATGVSYAISAIRIRMVRQFPPPLPTPVSDLSTLSAGGNLADAMFDIQNDAERN